MEDPYLSENIYSKIEISFSVCNYSKFVLSDLWYTPCRCDDFSQNHKNLNFLRKQCFGLLIYFKSVLLKNNYSTFLYF